MTNYTNYVQITQWCNDTMQADLCFHAGDNQEVRIAYFVRDLLIFRDLVFTSY